MALFWRLPALEATRGQHHHLRATHGKAAYLDRGDPSIKGLAAGTRFPQQKTPKAPTAPPPRSTCGERHAHTIRRQGAHQSKPRGATGPGARDFNLPDAETPRSR